MLRNNVGRLPVVSREDPSRLVGYLGRATILAARLRKLDEEHIREPGWLRGQPMCEAIQLIALWPRLCRSPLCGQND